MLDKSFTRKCPTCPKILSYNSVYILRESEKRKTRCYVCAFSDRINKMDEIEKIAATKRSVRRYELRRKEVVWSFLLTHPCVDCGEGNILFLEFDHVGEKVEWISWLLRKHASIKDIQDEMKKCMVRCIGCHRKKTKREYKNRSQTKQVIFINEYLKCNPCVDCMEGDFELLEFDHVRGEKTMNVSSLVGGRYSLDRISLEIDKCEIICVKCHRKRTARRGNWKILTFLENAPDLKENPL